MNEQLPEGISFLEAGEIHGKPGSLQASIAMQQYLCTPAERGIVAGEIFQLESWEEKVVVRRRKKKRPKEIQLGSCVSDVELLADGLRFSILHRQEGSLKPMEVLEALSERSALEFSIRKEGVELQIERQASIGEQVPALS